MKPKRSNYQWRKISIKSSLYYNDYRLRLGKLREAIRSRLIKLEYCSTDLMKADILTKNFTEVQINRILLRAIKKLDVYDG